MRVEMVELAVEGGAHRAAGAVQHRADVERVARGLLALDEFAHAGFEDACQRAALVALAAGALVQRVQVAAGPEVAFELFGLPACGAQREQLAENIRPAEQGDAQQQGQDQLDQDVGVADQVNEGEVLDCVHRLMWG